MEEAQVRDGEAEGQQLGTALGDQLLLDLELDVRLETGRAEGNRSPVHGTIVAAPTLGTHNDCLHTSPSFLRRNVSFSRLCSASAGLSQ